MCGKVWEEGMRRFDIHHVHQCGMKSQAYDSVLDMKGLITYCHKCHMNLDIVIKKERTRTGNFKKSKQAKRHPFYRKRIAPKRSI
jgi:hypothetical protein